MSATILLVEDDRPIAENVILALARENIDCHHVTLVADGLARLRSGGFDLAILDVGLPDAREKLEDWCRHYNEDHPHSEIGYNVPIAMHFLDGATSPSS